MLTYVETTPIQDPLLLAYLARLERIRRSPLTVKTFRQTARRFEEYLRELGRSAADLTPVEAEEFFAGMFDLEPSTQHAHLKRLRSAYRYAQKLGLVERDPTFLVELPQPPRREPEIISVPELREIRGRAVTDQQWAAFHLLAFGGVRRAEAINACWRHFDFASATWTVPNGKGDKRRLIPIHPQLAEALRELSTQSGRVIAPRRGGSRLGRDTWDVIIRDLTEGTYTAHAFRRTVASSLAENGVPDPLIDAILGWGRAPGVGRKYYIRIAPAQLHRAILRLYADDPL